MAETVYVLCALASVLCAWLLFRAYRVGRAALLFWSSLCFAGLALNNLVLVVDLIFIPTVDLSLVRTVTGLVSMLVLVFGLVSEAR